MSFSTVDPLIQYTGNGSTVDFAFNHKFYDAGDLVVVLTDAAGVDTIQTITSEYTVVGVSDDAHDIPSTQKVVMIVAPAGGGTPELLTIYRMVDIIQSLVIGRDEGWLSLAAEKQFDLIVMMIQWVMLKVDRTAQYAITNISTPPSLEAVMAGLALGSLNDLLGKSTLVDADLTHIADSAASWADKKATMANVWAYTLTKIAANAVAAKVITFTMKDNGDSGAAKTIDFGVSQKHISTLTASCTYTFTNPPSPGTGNFALILVQGGVGSFAVTWPASVKWPGGTPPTLSTAPGSIDIVSFLYHADIGVYYGQYGLDFQ